MRALGNSRSNTFRSEVWSRLQACTHQMATTLYASWQKTNFWKWFAGLPMSTTLPFLFGQDGLYVRTRRIASSERSSQIRKTLPVKSDNFCTIHSPPSWKRIPSASVDGVSHACASGD